MPGLICTYLAKYGSAGSNVVGNALAVAILITAGFLFFSVTRAWLEDRDDESR